MLSFDVVNFIDENAEVKNRPKWKSFFDYLFTYFGQDNVDDEILQALNVSDLIESLKMYCSGKTLSRITASNYMTYLKDLFFTLNKKYGIRNETYDSRTEMDRLNHEAQLFINTLKPSEPKDVMSDDNYEELNYYLHNLFLSFDISSIIKNNIKSHSDNSENIEFKKYVTAVMTYFASKIPIGNNAMVNLKINFFNSEAASLTINEYCFSISIDFKKILDDYCSVRENLLQLYNESTEVFFINDKRLPFINYNGTSDNNSLYYHFRKINIPSKLQPLTNRVIYEMLNIGVSNLLIERIAEIPSERLMKISRLLDTSDKDNKLLYSFISGTSEEKELIKKRGYIKCQCCGREVQAVSDNLVLVKKKNSEKLYLTCNICKGEKWNK